MSAADSLTTLPVSVQTAIEKSALFQTFDSGLKRKIGKLGSSVKKKRFGSEIFARLRDAIVSERRNLNSRRPDIVLKARKRFFALHANRRHLKEYSQSLDQVIPGPDSIRLPLAVQKAVSTDSKLDFEAIQSFSKSLSEQKQQILWEQVYSVLELRIYRTKRRGPHSHLKKHMKGLQEFDEWLVSTGAKLNSSRNALQCRRPPNRITRRSYETIAEEIDDMQHWLDTENVKCGKLRDQYSAVNDGEAALKKRGFIQSQWDTNQLKCAAAAIHLKRLQEAITPDSGIGASQQASTHKQHSGEAHKPQYFDTPVFVRYNTLHYILKDILYQFKGAMFMFGRRAFPDIMESKNWNDPESIPVVAFVRLIKTNPEFQERVDFCLEDFRSLGMLRNAHAHEMSDFDVDQTIALLDDAHIAARALQMFHFLSKLHRYQTLLQDFKVKVVRNQQRQQQQYQENLTATENEWKVSQARLDQEEAELRSRLELVASAKNVLRANYDGAVAKIRRKEKESHHNLRNSIAEDLKEFTSDNQLRRMLNTLSPARASRLARKIQKAYATKRRQETPNSEEQQERVFEEAVADGGSSEQGEQGPKGLNTSSSGTGNSQNSSIYFRSLSLETGVDGIGMMQEGEEDLASVHENFTATKPKLSRFTLPGLNDGAIATPSRDCSLDEDPSFDFLRDEDDGIDDPTDTDITAPVSDTKTPQNHVTAEPDPASNKSAASLVNMLSTSPRFKRHLVASPNKYSKPPHPKYLLPSDFSDRPFGHQRTNIQPHKPHPHKPHRTAPDAHNRRNRLQIVKNFVPSMRERNSSRIKSGNEQSRISIRRVVEDVSYTAEKRYKQAFGASRRS
ncbi:hypothetical protein CC86DRAFT_378505 [Ophiobolus disseminans]|uniref:Uncharacterized protein n=1 Tax=Ophiobolus disseminans TaxID=1469910 RepID=A0A6A7AG78_9PLEO|nr:hypothetical protein CC86DRAFT_378505 [Ophiobolus disseminans]